MNEQKERQQQRWIWIAVAAFFFIFSSCVCCTFVGPLVLTTASFHGMSTILETVGDMDKAYYAECENLTVSAECNTCCRERGHEGMAFGRELNFNNYMCGCLGNP